LIIDDEKGHPDLLGKKELGRELEIKGIVTLFHGRTGHRMDMEPKLGLMEPSM